jgi:type IV secretory pathway TraG/TraD family ATPase VirD4
MSFWNGGVALGETKEGEPIAGHAPICCCIGTPGSGKSTSVLANTILDDDSGDRSVIVANDSKGELAAICAPFCRQQGPVSIVNGYQLLTDIRPDLKSDKWNPMLGPQQGTPSYEDDGAALARTMIMDDLNSHQKFFEAAARNLGAGFVLQEIKDAHRENRPPSVARVRMLATQPPSVMRDFIDRVISEGDPSITSRLAPLHDYNDATANVLFTLATGMEWAASPQLIADMDTDRGVNFADARRRRSTYFLNVPVEEQQSKAVYIGVALTDILRGIYRTPGLRVRVIVDEGGILLHHAELEQACAVLRGFGGTLLVAFQSITQMQQNYPKTWPLFLSGDVCCFRPGTLEDAEWMSKRAGQEIVSILSAAEPNSPNDLGPRPSWQQQKRDRFPAGSLFSMPNDIALVWRPGQEVPTIAHMKPYHAIPRLNARASANPYWKGASRNRRPSAAAVVAWSLATAGLAGWLLS